MILLVDFGLLRDAPRPVDNHFYKIDEIYRGLGKILNSLMNGPLGMSELEEQTGLEQSNLSRQVTELERGGCVVRLREGRSVRVEIADPSLRDLCELVCGALTDGG